MLARHEDRHETASFQSTNSHGMEGIEEGDQQQRNVYSSKLKRVNS